MQMRTYEREEFCSPRQKCTHTSFTGEDEEKAECQRKTSSLQISPDIPKDYMSWYQEAVKDMKSACVLDEKKTATTLVFFSVRSHVLPFSSALNIWQRKKSYQVYSLPIIFGGRFPAGHSNKITNKYQSSAGISFCFFVLYAL